MTCRLVCVLALSVATVVPARAANAQASDCTYDRCALRLQSTPFSDRVVQGAGAIPVARLGLFAPRIDPLATAADSARTYYASFKTHQNRGGALGLVGSIASVAAAIIWVTSDDYPVLESQGAFWGLFGVGAIFSIAGGINIRKGRDHLHQAIWFYNRSLVAVP